MVPPTQLCWRYHSLPLNQRYDITVHWVSRHLNSPAYQLFVHEFIWAGIKRNIKAVHHWIFVRGIHRSPVDSSHKDLVMRKAFSCNDIIMNLNIFLYGIRWHHSHWLPKSHDISQHSRCKKTRTIYGRGRQCITPAMCLVCMTYTGDVWYYYIP